MLAEAMGLLISEKLPVRQIRVPRAEALEYFAACKTEHTLALAHNCMETDIACHACALGGERTRR